MKKRRNITLSLNQQTIATLKQVATDTGIPMSVLVERSLLTYLNKRGILCLTSKD